MSMKRYGYARRTAALSAAVLIVGCADAGRNGDYAASAAGDSPAAGVADPAAASGSGLIEAGEGRGIAHDAPDGGDRPVTSATATAASTGSGLGVVVFLGTSLTAGYGLSPEQAYPALIQRRIDEARLPFRVANAGVSGETSAGALRRVDWLLQQPFDILVVETGGNDMLRGTEPAATEANIQAIVDRVRERRPDARIVLAGMLAMPNLGRDYGDRFEAIYPRLAARNDLVLIPFLLDGVAGDARLNQPDGVHPTAEGQRIVAENVWTTLEPVLRAEAPNRM